MSQNGKAGTIMDIIRSIFAFIDWAFFLLLGWIYEIFFSVSNAQLFSNETINAFFSRMQLIIGVFMVFKLSISVLQAIVNPDKISDKNNGFSSIITRVVMCLAMLTLLVPVNIPNARTEYEVQINNNGLLFGTLYSLQYRLLSENTIGKLVLGTESSTSVNDLKESGKNFTATLLKGFVRINMKSSGSNDYMCGDKQDIINTYNSTTDAGTVFFDLVNQKCGGWGDEKYVFAYIPLIGAITAAVFTIILIGFCADVAIRAIKLSILRLIAPIPIIAYLDPNQEKKGAFANWIQMLTSTYLDLFLRLAIVYFVIFLIQDIMAHGLIINTGSGITGFITFVIICIGLFIFAKQAPKFIKDALGLKNSLSNVGLGAILAGAGAVYQGGNAREVRESMYDSIKANNDAYISGKPGMNPGTAYNFGRDQVAKAVTGDNNATGRMMTRGRKHLEAMGIDNARVKGLKESLPGLEQDKDFWQDNYNRFMDGHMSATEQDNIANELGLGALSRDSNGNLTQDSWDTLRKGMYVRELEAKDKFEGATKDLEDMKGMQKKYLASRTDEAKFSENRENRAVIPNRQSMRDGSQRRNGQTYEATSSTTPQNSLGSTNLPDFTPPGATTNMGPMNNGGRPGGGPPPGPPPGPRP